MKIVQKKNKQLRIDDARLPEFLAQGFVEIDQKTGKSVIRDSNDELKALKRENAALKKENAALKEQLAKLSEQ